MPEPSCSGYRDFLPSANQALTELEAATGKPVQIVEEPDLKVLATIRRAGPDGARHLLRLRAGANRVADYLIAFECRMALRDGPGPGAVLRDNPAVREQVIRDCQALHSQLPPDRTQKLGTFIYDGLLLQLRSMGPGLLVDRWIREHCPDLNDPQATAIEAEINGNLAVLQPSTRANYPAGVYGASLAMNGAYAIAGGDLLGKPFLAVPYISQGYGAIGRRLIGLALGNGDQGQPATDRALIDGWARELAIDGWYEWSEPSESPGR